MNYTEFRRSLLKEGVTTRSRVYGFVVEQGSEGFVIEGEATEFDSMSEVKSHIRSKLVAEGLPEQRYV